MEPDFVTPAHWYDGYSAIRHSGEARWDGADRLTLRSDAGETADLFVSDLQFFEHRRNETVYRRSDNTDFRLILRADLPSGLAGSLPARQNYGAWIDRIGLGKAAAAFAVASAAALALFLSAPTWLGPMVPQAWERRLGNAMIGDLGNRMCSTPEGNAALATLLAKVDPANTKVRAGIANIDMVNAVALPGGQVLLFDGLVQEAETPEELAGVLAHEVGHVRERHVMTALLRQFGLSILTSGINSNVGSGALAATTMRYSRDAEVEADDWARAAMRTGDVSPVGAARFFERQVEEAGAGDTPEAMEWLSTHPAQAERAKAFRDSAIAGRDYPPVLNKAEFKALKGMCAADPDVEEFALF